MGGVLGEGWPELSITGKTNDVLERGSMYTHRSMKGYGVFEP